MLEENYRGKKKWERRKRKWKRKRKLLGEKTDITEAEMIIFLTFPFLNKQDPLLFVLTFQEPHPLSFLYITYRSVQVGGRGERREGGNEKRKIGEGAEKASAGREGP